MNRLSGGGGAGTTLRRPSGRQQGRIAGLQGPVCRLPLPCGESPAGVWRTACFEVSAGRLALRNRMLSHAEYERPVTSRTLTSEEQAKGSKNHPSRVLDLTSARASSPPSAPHAARKRRDCRSSESTRH